MCGGLAVCNTKDMNRNMVINKTDTGDQNQDAAPPLPDEAIEPIADLTSGMNGMDGDANGANRVIRRGGDALDVDWHEERRGTLPGNRYVRVLRSQDRVFRQVSPDHLVAGESITAPRSPLGRLRRALVGRPIATEQQAHERLTNVKALAIFSSDALSSVAYATEAILGVLILAGAAAFGYTIPISIGIAVLAGNRRHLVPADDLRLPERRERVSRRQGKPRPHARPDRRSVPAH